MRCAWEPDRVLVAERLFYPSKVPLNGWEFSVLILKPTFPLRREGRQLCPHREPTLFLLIQNKSHIKPHVPCICVQGETTTQEIQEQDQKQKESHWIHCYSPHPFMGHSICLKYHALDQRGI